MKRYPIWSYLNTGAIDAPLISVAWYLYFAQKSPETSINVLHCLILGPSVWLGYMADRLFDIHFRKEAQLSSLRHQFCKEYETILWTLWKIILITTVILSLYVLNSDKIFVGLFFVFFILLYNLLNQCFPKKRFPKEFFIAVIFAYGTLFFIDGALNVNNLTNFGLICFLNCVILTHKDSEVDDLMGVSSWTHSFSHRFIFAMTLLSSIYYLIALKGILNPFFATSLISMLLHISSHYFDEEQFRVIMETLYIIIPIVALVC